jgi:hypothetical protein
MEIKLRFVVLKGYTLIEVDLVTRIIVKRVGVGKWKWKN